MRCATSIVEVDATTAHGASVGRWGRVAAANVADSIAAAGIGNKAVATVGVAAMRRVAIPCVVGIIVIGIIIVGIVIVIEPGRSPIVIPSPAVTVSPMGTIDVPAKSPRRVAPGVTIGIIPVVPRIPSVEEAAALSAQGTGIQLKG